MRRSSCMKCDIFVVLCDTVKTRVYYVSCEYFYIFKGIFFFFSSLMFDYPILEFHIQNSSEFFCLPIITSPSVYCRSLKNKKKKVENICVLLSFTFLCFNRDFVLLFLNHNCVFVLSLLATLFGTVHALSLKKLSSRVFICI